MALGPDDYELEMNRVLLGHVAVTYVACTSRIRVVSAAAATEYALYLPFSGSIQLIVDGLEMTASAERPLLPLQRFSVRDRLARLPEAIRRYEQSIIDLVARAVAERSGDGQACNVESLKAWLAAHAHRRVRMSELATRAGVSLRTVERAFLRTGGTPLDHLRLVRLNRARTILAGPVADVTVADVAAAVGYTHLGRFADEYRQHVGELPSQTLARGRSGGAA